MAGAFVFLWLFLADFIGKQGEIYTESGGFVSINWDL